MAPAIAIFCIFGLPIVAYIVVKTLAHNERMEMIRMGYYGGYPPNAPAPAAPAATVVLRPPLRAAAPGATLVPVRPVSGTNRRGS